jgi:hypothetical protein
MFPATIINTHHMYTNGSQIANSPIKKITLQNGNTYTERNSLNENDA